MAGLWLLLGIVPSSIAAENAQVRLMTLDPGHFHAALVQKTMHERIVPTVHVYAPKGPDVEEHLRRIEAFNRRADGPTRWDEQVYTGDDFLERMLKDKPGNVVVIAGNNRRKAQYIKACVEAGLNVLADKPMCIDRQGLRLVEEAFDLARRNGVVLYDIMTERFEITSILQKELANDSDVFGQRRTGSVEEPAVVKESVHHFFKQVAGSPLRRPAWYFDTAQQGEGIVDVTTHLVDLAMWSGFPRQAIDYSESVVMKQARRWPTPITREHFTAVTGLDAFPDFLTGRLNGDGVLPCYANAEMVYTLNGIHVKVSVRWDFQAPPGAGDTHFSVVRGTRADIVIRQGKEQAYRPELYVEPAPEADRDELERALKKAIAALQDRYPGVALEASALSTQHSAHSTSAQPGGWHVRIPDRYRVGHEAHFAEVVERYLGYLSDGKLPDWEMSNMITKYRTTIAAQEAAARQEMRK